MTTIRLAQVADIPLLREHLHRIVLESGRDGDFIFAPNEEPNEGPYEEFEKRNRENWQKLPTEKGWERCWVITDEKAIYGELMLVHSPPTKSSLHRALLMMGIERSHRKQGFGPELMNQALAWAKAQPTLDWIQLCVFEDNEPAKKLYSKFGFQKVGTMPDMFRVHGRKMDDTSMLLKLR